VDVEFFLELRSDVVPKNSRQNEPGRNDARQDPNRGHNNQSCFQASQSKHL
jgi:hypothetical protein